MKITSYIKYLALAGAASLSSLHGQQLNMQPIGTLDLGGSEISAFDPSTDRLFVSSPTGLQVVNLADPANPSLLSNIDFTTVAYGSQQTSDVNSVASQNGVVVAVLRARLKSDPGVAVFLNASDLSFIAAKTVGVHPDHVGFSPNGRFVLVANEGELGLAQTQIATSGAVGSNVLTTAVDLSNFTLGQQVEGTGVPASTTITALTSTTITLSNNITAVNPEIEIHSSPATDLTPGSVSIIDLGAPTNIPSASVTTVGFASFDATAAALATAGVRLFAGALPSTDFEPEYVAVSPDSTRAMVTLQEANAVALMDLDPTSATFAQFLSIVPLGTKDFSALLADFSDRDGPSNSTLIRLTTGNPVRGLYMPDAIASFQVGGNTFYAIANEGDDRDDFLKTAETIRVGSGSYVLDPTLFPNSAVLKQNANLGRLTVSNSPGLRGDIDNDGDVDQILAYGGRSFSILDSSGNIIYDSADFMEKETAFMGLPWFDDTRSDNKAAEPEGVTTGVIDGKTYVFVGLERSRGVMAFDVSNPTNVKYAGFGTQKGATDQNPEGLVFIPAVDSPNGQDLLIVCNENNNTVSGSPTMTVYSVGGPYTLQLLHFADAEAGQLASQTAPNLAALVDRFEDEYDNTLILAGGDNYIPGPFAAAGTDSTVVATHTKGNNPFAADIEIHNRIGVQASTVGNHEFDFGVNAFADALIDAAFPYLSANLDFTVDSAISGRFTETVGNNALENINSLAARVAPSAVAVINGERIGLVGATTQLIKNISSAGSIGVKGFSGAGQDDMPLLANQLQPVIDDLVAQGVNKIILMSHLQNLNNERALASLLRNVDIILAAGSNTRLGDADDVAVAFPGHAANFADTYPIIASGLDSNPTLIVNTDNEFTYLGRLVVDFDVNGIIDVAGLAARVPVNGAYAATEANVASAWGVPVNDLSTTAFAGGTKGQRVKQITDAVQSVILSKDGIVHGFTLVYLEGERNFVRSQETNLGSITADANLSAYQAAAPSDNIPVVSLKNGGGIRAAVGSIVVGSGEKIPPVANADAGKPFGAVSQLDVENSLRFNNRLMVCDTTPTGLKAILEHGVAAGLLEGRFPQVGGVAFAWDPSRPAGDRITSISLINEDGSLKQPIFKRGTYGSVILNNAPATIRLVTLNFLAGNKVGVDTLGGDNYPIKPNAVNFRYILGNGTLGGVLDEALNFTAGVPSDVLGEQKAFADYMSSRHPTYAQGYALAEVPSSLDKRIQNLSSRSDGVEPVLGLDTDGDGLSDLEEELFGTNSRAGLRIGDSMVIDLSRLVVGQPTGTALRVLGRLPAGLVFNSANNSITGTLLGEGGFAGVQIQLVNNNVVLNSFSLSLNIQGFPVGLLGQFEALLESNGSPASPNGLVRLFITRAGQFTANLDYLNARRRSARGSFSLVEGENKALLELNFAGAGATPAVSVELEIDASTPLIAGDVTVNNVDSGVVRGFRLAALNATPAATTRTNIALDAGVQDGISVPAGFGWLSGTTTSRGAISVRGLLGDGKAVTASMQLGATGQALFWAQPYSDKTSKVGGVVPVENLGQPLPFAQRLANGLRWFRNSDVRELSYPDGFAELTLQATSSRVQPLRTPVELATQLGLADSKFNVEILGAGYDNTGANDSPILPIEFTLGNRFSLVSSAPLNALPLIGGRVQNTSGAVTGTLSLPVSAAVNSSAGRGSVTAILLPELNLGNSVGVGQIKVPVSGRRGAFRTVSFLLER
jgi:2',3'-cyclic-nucleotide 2'-phosphodiesterase (5'-nucleotidase family)